jgi:hypothetical protein
VFKLNEGNSSRNRGNTNFKMFKGKSKSCGDGWRGWSEAHSWVANSMVRLFTAEKTLQVEKFPGEEVEFLLLIT